VLRVLAAGVDRVGGQLLNLAHDRGRVRAAGQRERDLDGRTVDLGHARRADLDAGVAPGAFGVIILDGAGWHRTGGKLIVPDNITLLPLPPYAPELNPMENLWEYLRQNKLCALVWDTYEAIVQACRDAWKFLVDDPARIQSIGTREWACVNV